MKGLTRVIAVCAFTLSATLISSAQATRTWVSGVGDDANPCSRTAPCKTFAGAISKTATGGEIDALDPGGFGTLTITKSITIDGGGVLASVLASGTTGLIVSAGASDVVTLRNLSINGAGTTPGTNGINVVSAGTVHIEKSSIFGFSQSGITVATGGAGTDVTVDHCAISNNAVAGIKTANTGTAPALVTVTNTTLSNNGVGLQALGVSKVTAENVVATGNTGAGFQADASSGAATINLVSSVAANNAGPGIQASSTGSTAATIRISGVSVFSNGSGLSIGTNGNVFSFGDNLITGGGVPTSTLSKQ